MIISNSYSGVGRGRGGGGGVSHETCHGVGHILRTNTQLIFPCLNLTSFYQLKKNMVSDHWLYHYDTDNQAHLIMPSLLVSGSLPKTYWVIIILKKSYSFDAHVSPMDKCLLDYDCLINL